MFIDYGNTEFVLFDGLCEMASVDRKEPAMAFECYLSGIKPPLMKWTEKACIRFNELTMDKHLQADVRTVLYYVSHGSHIREFSQPLPLNNMY